MYEHLDRRYALALYEVAEKKGKVDEYIQELKDILKLIKENDYLQEVIKHPRISTLKKKEIFKTIFSGKISEDVLSFLLVLIDKDRILYLDKKITEMEKIKLEKSNIMIAEVKSALPLTGEEKESIKNLLRKKYSKDIIIKDSIDKSVIGGVYIKIGDDIIDGTLKNKLNMMKELILKG